MDDVSQGLEATDQAPVAEQGTGEAIDAAPSEENLEIDQPLPSAVETQGQQVKQEETFLTGDELDPRKLDQALQPILKKMQAAYTKRMQAIAEIRDKATVVDRFYQDPAFAYQTLAQWATQNGYQLSPGTGQAQPQQQRGFTGDTPAQLVEAFKQNLAPELQWMAEPQAKAMWASMQSMLQPVLQQQQQQTQVQREQEWDKYATELAQVAPGWEEHEDQMGELYDFLRSPNNFHPTYGSKLQMLYDLATAKAASLKQAQQRVQTAGKNRVTSGRSTGVRPNIENEIAKASTQDAWKLAVKHALAQQKPVA